MKKIIKLVHDYNELCDKMKCSVKRLYVHIFHDYSGCLVNYEGTQVFRFKTKKEAKNYLNEQIQLKKQLIK